MRADCHRELSKTCTGSLLHLAVAPNDELGEGGGFTVQQRGHVLCNIATHLLTLQFSMQASLYIGYFGLTGLKWQMLLLFCRHVGLKCSHF